MASCKPFIGGTRPAPLPRPGTIACLGCDRVIDPLEVEATAQVYPDRSPLCYECADEAAAPSWPRPLP